MGKLIKRCNYCKCWIYYSSGAWYNVADDVQHKCKKELSASEFPVNCGYIVL